MSTSTLKNNVQNENEIKTRTWTEQDKKNLIRLYPTKTTIELCKILEKSEGQIRGMKERLGLNYKINHFSSDEIIQIKKFYEENDGKINLEEFSLKLGRPKTSISRCAKRMGLTKQNRPLTQSAIQKMKRSMEEYRQTDAYINNIKKQQKGMLAYYAKNKHPKGMLGKHHTKSTCEQLSKSHIELFQNMSTDEKHRRAMKAVETKRKNGGFCTTSNAYSRCHGGFREDIGQYFRSNWEANVVRILNYLHIEWKYEYKRFDFSKEKFEVLSYQPDFYLPEIDRWVEVKGWMDEKSKKRLELFKRYYSEEAAKLILIGEKEYQLLEKKYSNIIDNWE